MPGIAPTALPTTGRLLCIDPGAKRIGLALSDPTQSLAHPLATLTRRAGRRFPMAALRKFLDEHQPVGIVVGLALDMEGHEGLPASEARAIGELIGSKTGLPVAYADERLSTAQARRSFDGLPSHRRPDAGTVDRMAATVILQAFLDRRRP